MPATSHTSPSVSLHDSLVWLKGVLCQRFGLELENISTPDTLAETFPACASLQKLAAIFSLSSFEQKVLLLSASLELDSSFRHIYLALNPESAYPTFGMALAAFADAEWQAFTPRASLRHWQLLHVDGDWLNSSNIRINERILHYLVGIQERDSKIMPYVACQPPTLSPMTAHWRALRQQAQELLQSGHTLHIQQSKVESVMAFVHEVQQQMGWEVLEWQGRALPSNADEIEQLSGWLEREHLLHPFILLVDYLPEDPSYREMLANWLHHVAVPIITRDNLVEYWRGSSIVLPLPERDVASQEKLWRSALESMVTDGDVDDVLIEKLSQQYHFGTQRIENCIQSALWSDMPWQEALLQQCQQMASRAMHGLAIPVISEADWDDLIVSETVQARLEDIKQHAWARPLVKASKRALAVLFSGVSGTGKTMAAGLLAKDLGLALYRVDLSQLISKYVGETEKKLERLFQAAEASRVVLLFDEADALFAKRGEVRGSQDRYANQEVSYLLQRLEHYDGIVILTTNLQPSIDKAFLRRFSFVINFSFPNQSARERLWQKTLARFSIHQSSEAIQEFATSQLSGANIHNIVFHAVCLAKAQNVEVSMHHVKHAIGLECEKLGKHL